MLNHGDFQIFLESLNAFKDYVGVLLELPNIFLVLRGILWHFSAEIVHWWNLNARNVKYSLDFSDILYQYYLNCFLFFFYIGMSD